MSLTATFAPWAAICSAMSRPMPRPAPVTSATTKVADFGVARIEHNDLTVAGSVIGTPGYMAPEQFVGDDPADPTKAEDDGPARPIDRFDLGDPILDLPPELVPAFAGGVESVPAESLFGSAAAVSARSCGAARIRFRVSEDIR